MTSSDSRLQFGYGFVCGMHMRLMSPSSSVAPRVSCETLKCLITDAVRITSDQLYCNIRYHSVARPTFSISLNTMSLQPFDAF